MAEFYHRQLMESDIGWKTDNFGELNFKVNSNLNLVTLEQKPTSTDYALFYLKDNFSGLYIGTNNDVLLTIGEDENNVHGVRVSISSVNSGYAQSFSIYKSTNVLSLGSDKITLPNKVRDFYFYTKLVDNSTYGKYIECYVKQGEISELNGIFFEELVRSKRYDYTDLDESYQKYNIKPEVGLAVNPDIGSVSIQGIDVVQEVGAETGNKVDITKSRTKIFVKKNGVVYRRTLADNYCFDETTNGVDVTKNRVKINDRLLLNDGNLT